MDSWESELTQEKALTNTLSNRYNDVTKECYHKDCFPYGRQVQDQTKLPDLEKVFNHPTIFVSYKFFPSDRINQPSTFISF